MPEDVEQEEGGGDAAESEQGSNGNAASGVVDRVRSAFDGEDGIGKTALIPAGVAAVAALGYAATKAAPKVKDSLTTKAADEAEEATEGALSKAEGKGGATGMAAKLLRKKDGDDGDGGGMLGGLASKVVPGGGEKDPSKGWGKGRRNPIQRYCDVGVPVDVAYNQWTQFEEFPKFMHRVVNVSHDEEDRAKLKWEEKIWFWTRDWEAEITEQIPDYKIAWKTVSGTSHVGQVTFHALSENMTRVLITIDFNPSGVFEKMASGLRFVKRAAESDLCRFKAFIEAHGEATGAWRGRIEDGEVVEDPKVEEGKPIEETEKRRTPGGKAAGDDSDEDEDSDEGPKASGSDDEDADEPTAEEREAEREEREKRREERRAAAS